MADPIAEVDHGEDDMALRFEAADQKLGDLQARLHEVGELLGWGKAVLDETEGQARKLAFEYGWPGESQGSQR